MNSHDNKQSHVNTSEQHNMSYHLSQPVLDLEGSHLFRYLSELDPRRANNAKGGDLKGKIILPSHIINDNLHFILSTCLSSSGTDRDHHPHSSLIHVVRKMDDNRRNRDKETVPTEQHWRQEFQVINKEVYIRNNKSVADEKRGPIPDLDKICPVKENIITLDGHPTSINLALLLLKTEAKARNEELHLDRFLEHQVSDEHVRKSLRNTKERNKLKIKLEIFDTHGSPIGVAWSKTINNSASTTCGPLSIHDVTPLKSCSEGGRKVIMISEFTLAKDVKPRFQLYDQQGTHLAEQEEWLLTQPNEKEVRVRRDTIIFMTPKQNKADQIFLKRLIVKLVLVRQSDGVISSTKPIFELVPHDYHVGTCLLCHYHPDGEQCALPKIIRAHPGTKRRL